MSDARAALKSVIEHALGAPPIVSAALRRLRGARLVLSYHNIVASESPPSSGDRSLHLPLGKFREQLDAIAKAGLPIVRLDRAVSPTDPPSVVVTFDDAYAGALEYGLPELTARGLPCTIFVAPGLLGSPGPWWDRLASPETGAVPEAVRHSALDDFAGEETRVLRAAADRRWAVSAPAPQHRIADQAELDRAIQLHSGLTLGAHTWSHPNVSALSLERLQQELAEPREWLTTRYGTRYVDWLAYPYGLRNAASESASAAVGYTGSLLVSGGWDRGRAAPHAHPRFNVTPGLSTAGFRMRLAGFL